MLAQVSQKNDIMHQINFQVHIVMGRMFVESIKRYPDKNFYSRIILILIGW